MEPGLPLGPSFHESPSYSPPPLEEGLQGGPRGCQACLLGDGHSTCIYNRGPDLSFHVLGGGGVSGDLGIPFTKAGKLTCEQGEAAFHN